MVCGLDERRIGVIWGIDINFFVIKVLINFIEFMKYSDMLNKFVGM